MSELKGARSSCQTAPLGGRWRLGGKVRSRGSFTPAPPRPGREGLVLATTPQHPLQSLLRFNLSHPSQADSPHLPLGADEYISAAGRLTTSVPPSPARGLFHPDKLADFHIQHSCYIPPSQYIHPINPMRHSSSCQCISVNFNPTDFKSHHPTNPRQSFPFSIPSVFNPIRFNPIRFNPIHLNTL